MDSSHIDFSLVKIKKNAFLRKIKKKKTPNALKKRFLKLYFECKKLKHQRPHVNKNLREKIFHF